MGRPGPSVRYGPAMHYLDVHSGSLQVLSSGVLVVVTAVYTILTRTMAKAAREALRPYVYLDVSFASPAEMTVLIGNSGTKAAANVKATISTANNEELKKALEEELPLGKGLGHLVPGSTRRYRVAVTTKDLFPEDGPPAMVEFEFTYHDGSRKITDRQQIDLAGYWGSKFSLDPAHGIVQGLHSIANRIPQVRTSTIGFGKSCPYCGTKLVESAKKCHGCLEWLPGAAAPRSGFQTRFRKQQHRPHRGRRVR